MAKTKSKKVASSKRDKRKLRIRAKVRGTVERPRISVFRSSKHIYAQIISDETQKTLVSASTLEDEVKKVITTLASAAKDAKGSSKSVIAAKAVGQVLAQRGKAAKVDAVVFDRNGFLYSGRIKALADGAREGGLNF